MACFILCKQLNRSYLTITGSRSFTMVNLLIFDSPTGSAGWSARPDGPTRKSRTRNSSIHLIRNRRKFWGAVGDFGQARRMFEHARRRRRSSADGRRVWRRGSDERRIWGRRRRVAVNDVALRTWRIWGWRLFGLLLLFESIFRLRMSTAGRVSGSAMTRRSGTGLLRALITFARWTG